MKKHLIFTGGGSGGHVMPALTIIKKINADHLYNIHYIGGIQSIERDLVKDYDLTYHPIHTGKLRRYLSKENLKDIFNVFLGLIESFKLLWKFSSKHTLIFSTGGFVSVPVVIAAKLQLKKVYIHEQTSRVGLANKICSIFADKVFVSFEDSLKYFPQGKTFLSGYPVREECFLPKSSSLILDGVDLMNQPKPIMFVTGGGNGSLLVNNLIKSNFKILTERFFIVHQVGKSFFDEFNKLKNENYLPLPFIGKEMIDLYKVSQVVVSRSGAGTVCELLALKKASIFIPLKIAQKNEQYHNAMEAKRKLGSIVIEEDKLTDESFLKSIHDLKNQSSPKNEDKNVQEALNFLVQEINQF